MSGAEKEVLNSNDFEESIKIIKKYWNTGYGTLEIWKKQESNKTMLELTTGGYSDNEEFIDELADTWFWFLWWQESKRGGYYKFISSEVIKYE